MSQIFATPQEKFSAAYRALLPDLNPEGALECMFAEKFARNTVLLEQAQSQILRADPFQEETKKLFRQLTSLIASCERAQKTAYSELRRLQTQRAAEMPAETPLTAKPRLARVAILTKPDGSLRKDAPLPGVTEAPAVTLQARTAA